MANRTLTNTATIAWNVATANQVKANVPDASITNAKLASMAQTTIKGRAAGAGTGDPTDLTAAQVKSALGYPTVSVDNIIPRFDGTDGGLQTSGISINDNDVMAGLKLIATGQTASRASGDFLADLNSLKNFGAVGDGTTDDTAAVTAAEALAGAKFVPEGIYDTTTSQSAFRGPYWGFGQMRDSANNLRAPWFSAIAAAPSSFGDFTSVLTAFNGDLSKVQIAMEHRVTGAASAGQPASGYLVRPEVSPIVIYHYGEAGHNQSTSGNDGRTGQSIINLNFAHTGQGDMGGIFVNGIVTGSKPGATSFLASPAAAIIYGQCFSAATGAYLNIIELNANDNGFQSAAVGAVHNFARSVATATLGEVWMGTRHQSANLACDVAYSAAGAWKRGIDLTPVTFDANKAAITLSADDRIYGNSSDSGDVSWSQTLGDDYFLFNATRGWEFFVDGVSAVRMSPGGVFAVRSEDAGAGGGPFLGINRVSASPAAADQLGFLVFNGQDSGGNETAYAFLAASILDPTNGSEDGQLTLNTMIAGASTQTMAWANGITLGSPASGFLGSGTLNAAGLINSLASVRAHSGTAVPAGGTAGAGLLVSATTNLGIFFGSGVPTLSAAQGSLYIRTDGSSTSTRLYVNTNGTTGWTNATTAA